MADQNTRTHSSSSHINEEQSGMIQKEIDHTIPQSPAGGAYASSSSALSSISTSSMPDPPSSVAIADNPVIPRNDLSPYKSGLTLKLNFGQGLNMAPATASSSTTAAGPSLSPHRVSPTKPNLPNSTMNRRKNGGAKRRKGRKSGKYDDDEDGVIKAEDSDSDGESSAPTPVATQTKSGRQIHRPSVFIPPEDKPLTPHTEDAQPSRKKRKVYRKGKEGNVLCCRCDRGHSPTENVIVFCDECNSAWHQFCHDPPIDKEVVTVKEKEWSCSECRPVEPPFSDNYLTLQARANGGAAAAASKYKAPLSSPWGVNRTPLVGGSRVTAAKRRGYLTGLSHATLVKLLMDISDTQPDIPLFPEGLQELRYSASTQPTIKPIKEKENAVGKESNPTLVEDGASLLNGSTVMPLQSNGLHNPSSGDAANDEDEDGEDEDDEIEEYRLYPRAGNGFVLPPDSVDLDMLLEDPSSTTFSHALHGVAKATTEASQLQTVGVA